MTKAYETAGTDTTQNHITYTLDNLTAGNEKLEQFPFTQGVTVLNYTEKYAYLDHT